MATGDVTVSIAVEGGVTKSATFNSAARVKSKAGAVASGQSDDIDLSVDADWQIFYVNKFAKLLINQANRQLESELTYTAKTYSAAS